MTFSTVQDVSSRFARSTTAELGTLDLLEAEAIHVIREVVAEFERPVLLFSGGKDSVVVLHLAAKAFAPGRVPFPVLHVDTGHNFPEVLAFRDEAVARLGVRLEVARVQDYIDDGRLQERADGTRNPLQTLPLLDAIAAGRHDAVFGGARRDEDKARAKERVFSFRDETVGRLGIRLEVASVQEYLDDGRLQERADGTRNPLQTQPLLDAIAAGRHDAVFGGARRDEDKARAKERIISLRDEFGQWDPRNQRPELWSLYNGRHTVGQHVRAFPISNWTELDVWRYIEREGIALPPLYFAHERDVYARDGMWLAVSDVSAPRAGETVERRTVRYRTVGDLSCTGAVLSDAATLPEIVRVVAASTLTERGATRADDRLSEAAMEDRKKDGYF